MRTLNLSRLARTSESQFFKNEQAQQAISLRKTLTDADIASTNANTVSATTTATTDVLPEIYAHSTQREFIRHALRDSPRTLAVRPKLNASSSAGVATKLSSTLVSRAPDARSVVDASVLRALGSSRLSLYRKVAERTPSARPLPGGDKYAEGAVVGLASFSIATAAVASIGIAGAIVLWNRPSIVDAWRRRSIALRVSLDRTVGHRIRQSVSPRIRDGHVISDNARHRASSFARSAIGTPKSSQLPLDKNQTPSSQNR